MAQYECGRTEVGKERVLRTLLSLVKSKNPKCIARALKHYANHLMTENIAGL